MSEPNLYFVWRDYQRRAEVVAPRVGAEAIFLPHRFRSRWLRPLDYALKFVRTTALLLRRRPRFALFQAPPVFTALPARLLGVPYVIDAHNATFQSGWRRVPLSGWLMRGAAAVVAHNDEIVALAREAFPGARFAVVADPVPTLPGAGDPAGRRPDQVLLIASFAPDEPIDVLLDVIEGAPDLAFVVTADPNRLPGAQRDRLRALPNARLTGFLAVEAYHRVLAESRAAVVLTTRPATQPSGACEALASDTPLILSRSSLTTRLFGGWARLVDPSAAAILDALRSPSLAAVDLSRERERWNREVDRALAGVVAMASGTPARPEGAP